MTAGSPGQIGAAARIRTVHVPPPFLSMLQKHLLEHTAEGPRGLLFPGDRTDHMSVRYFMDRYRPARGKAGRPDLTIHHLRHTALTLAGQHGATARRTPGSCRSRLTSGHGDPSTRHPRPRQGTRREDRRNVQRVEEGSASIENCWRCRIASRLMLGPSWLQRGTPCNSSSMDPGTVGRARPLSR